MVDDQFLDDLLRVMKETGIRLSQERLTDKGYVVPSMPEFLQFGVDPDHKARFFYDLVVIAPPEQGDTALVVHYENIERRFGGVVLGFKAGKENTLVDFTIRGKRFGLDVRRFYDPLEDYGVTLERVNPNRLGLSVD